MGKFWKPTLGRIRPAQQQLDEIRYRRERGRDPRRDRYIGEADRRDRYDGYDRRYNQNRYARYSRYEDYSRYGYGESQYRGGGNSMWGLVGGALSAIGSIAGGLFGFKKEQARVVQSAFGVLDSINSSDDARAVAAAQIIAHESRSESWITRIWRPVTVLMFVGLLMSHLLGFTAPGLSDQVVMRIFDIVEYAVLGYMGMRTVDKAIRDLGLTKVLKTFIEKKVL